MLFDWQMESSLKAALGLLKGRTLDSWQFSNDASADVILYEPGHALAQAMLRRSNERGGQVFVAVSDPEDASSVRFPFAANIGRLAEALDGASVRLQVDAPRKPVRAPASSLCQRLDDACRTPDGRSVALHVAGRVGYLDLQRRALLWPGQLTIDEIALLLGEEVSVRAARGAPPAIDILAQPVSWEPLLWAIGVTQSRGTLLKRLGPEHSYRLARWPNFGAIGRRTADIRCCAMLTQTALSPRALATITGIPSGTVAGFYNAAALCGFLQEVAAPSAVQPEPPRSAGGAFGNLLRGLRRALALD